MGGGTEGVEAIENKRYYKGIELKREYFETTVNTLKSTEEILGQTKLEF